MKRPLVFLFAGAALMVSDSVAQNLHGNAAAGQVLFKELKCSVCHSVNGIGGKSAPSLGGPGYTPNKMVGAMWSHVTAMWQAMDREGIRRPQLTEKQAADLYVFFAGGFNADIKGDSKRGQQIYEAKFCASCHDAVETGAPRLSGRARSRSSFSLVAALWRHGGGMLSRMVAKNLQWQQLSSGEVGDIIEYLNVKQ
jgi:mono/diheme cytochrome c family protein